MIINFNEARILELKNKGVEDSQIENIKSLEQTLVSFVEGALEAKIVEEIRCSEWLLLGIVAKTLVGRQNMLPIPKLLPGHRTRSFIAFCSSLYKYRALKKKYGFITTDDFRKIESENLKKEITECEICEEPLETSGNPTNICKTCELEIEVETSDHDSEDLEEAA